MLLEKHFPTIPHAEHMIKKNYLIFQMGLNEKQNEHVKKNRGELFLLGIVHLLCICTVGQKKKT